MLHQQRIKCLLKLPPRILSFWYHMLPLPSRLLYLQQLNQLPFMQPILHNRSSTHHSQSSHLSTMFSPMFTMLQYPRYLPIMYQRLYFHRMELCLQFLLHLQCHSRCKSKHFLHKLLSIHWRNCILFTNPKYESHQHHQHHPKQCYRNSSNTSFRQSYNPSNFRFQWWKC